MFKKPSLKLLFIGCLWPATGYAQKFHFAITGGSYVVLNSASTSGPVTEGTYLSPRARASVGATLGVRLRYQLGQHWHVDVSPELTQHRTNNELFERVYRPEQSSSPLLVTKRTWNEVSRELLLPVGLNRVVRCNDALWVQGILRQYVGFAYLQHRDIGMVSLQPGPDVQLAQASTGIDWNGGRVLAGAQVGFGLMLPRRLLEITVLYTRPQTPHRYFVTSSYDYRDPSGNEQNAAHQTQLRVRPDRLQAQLAVYIK